MASQTPVGTFLPLTSLSDFSAQIDFLRWLSQTKQNAWLMSPISDPIQTPYRNYGIGYSNYFLYQKRQPKEASSTAEREREEVWLLDRQEFFSQNHFWLNDYALHQALSEHFGTDCWWTWPEKLHYRQAAALDSWRLKLQDRIGFFLDQQYRLANQMAILRQEAQNRDLTLIGDLPFYIAQESPLVWTHQKAFLLRPNGELKMQSGVPSLPDEPFAAQFWGHPLYDWQGEAFSDIISIFNSRLDFLSQFFDLIRLDHANGFFRYGIMYPEHLNWCKKVLGPGKKALNLILEHARTLNLGIFLENIGSQTMRLEQYMKENHVPGMSIFTLAYNLDATTSQVDVSRVNKKAFDLQSYRGSQVIFSSTHDTLPLLAWWRALPEPLQKKFKKINDISPDLTEEKIVATIRDTLLHNQAKLVIIPWQDWHLETFRFNVPGREDLAAWQHQVNPAQYLSN